MLRRIAARSVPPPRPAPSALDQLGLLLKVELLPVWLFWENLRALRSWWPLLLPALVVYGLRVYRRERRQALERKIGDAVLDSLQGPD
jgi:hypothetical protein